MNKNTRLLVEAVAVGFILLIVATIVMAGLNAAVDRPPAAAYYAATFLTGVIVHLLCEATGVNRWYCDHGAACS